MIFEHYKGNRYRFIGLAIDEQSKQPMVLYSPVTDDTIVWSRKADQFFGTVPPGVEPRFKLMLP